MSIYNAHSQTTTMTIIASFLAVGVIMIPLMMALGVTWLEEKFNRSEHE